MIAAARKAQQDYSNMSGLLEEVDEHNELRVAATDCIRTLFTEDHLIPDPDWEMREKDFGIKKP